LNSRRASPSEVAPRVRRPAVASVLLLFGRQSEGCSQVDLAKGDDEL